MTSTFTGLELTALRAQTKAFILAAPNTISLVPTFKAMQDSGGYRVVDGFPRQPQTFKLIATSSSERPTEAGPDTGVVRMHDYILLGEWDAEVRPGDHWTDQNNIRYEVIALVPYNGYETRAEVTASGE